MKIRIATYNVGDFSGIDMDHGSEKSRSAFREVLEKTNADLWALQEDVEFFNGETKELPFDAVYKSVLPYYYRNYTSRYNGKVFLSRYEIVDVEPILYQGDYKFGHPWYYKGQIALSDKNVTLLCLHFDWSDNLARTEQISQMLEFAKTQEYCIIMGDFNPYDYINKEKQSNRSLYREDLAHFTKLGFEPINAGRFGTFDTIAQSAVSPNPCDNILVTPNIKILKVDRILEPWMNDHALLFADVEID